MTRRYFGTDGVRGPFGTYPITPDFALKLGWAAGRALSRSGTSTVVIGKDTRLSGYVLESALEAGLASAGIHVLLLGPVPTPAVAHLTRAFHADAGIVISASHNPFEDNGIKFFGADGKKLPDALEAAIEDEMDRLLEIRDPSAVGKVRRVEDARGRYIEFCKSTFPYAHSLKGLSIVVDCAHGATYQVGPAVFEELGATVHRYACAPDGRNINHEVGSTHPEGLQREVVARGADLGIAFDGDGDRVLMVDHTGSLIDGDEIVYLIAAARLSQGVPVPGVVGTQMSNLGLERALSALQIPFVRAAVGDRHVMAALESRGWTLGGESSGHVLCLDKASTGDAIVAALQVLAAMVARQQPLAALRGGLQPCPQVLVNVRLPQRIDLSQPAITAAVAAVESTLGTRGRVLLRASGTEPVVRVMVEGEADLPVDALAHQLADVVRGCLPA